MSLPGRIVRSLVARTRDALTVARYRSRAAALSKTADPVSDPDQLFDLVDGFEEFRPAQKRSEFLRLMERVRAIAPMASLEIGTATGGTAFLFARVLPISARLVTLDIADNAARRAAVRGFSHSGRRVQALCVDSHDPTSVPRVLRELGVSQLDFLFIDGDHSYEGVAADFRLHAPTVRDRGCVAFHDIVPDSIARRGDSTSVRTDGVPRFWQRLRAAIPEVEEFVEDPNQDGYGIGVVSMDVAVRRRLTSAGLLG